MLVKTAALGSPRPLVLHVMRQRRRQIQQSGSVHDKDIVQQNIQNTHTYSRERTHSPQKSHT